MNDEEKIVLFRDNTYDFMRSITPSYGIKNGIKKLKGL